MGIAWHVATLLVPVGMTLFNVSEFIRYTKIRYDLPKSVHSLPSESSQSGFARFAQYCRALAFQRADDWRRVRRAS